MKKKRRWISKIILPVIILLAASAFNHYMSYQSSNTLALTAANILFLASMFFLIPLLTGVNPYTKKDKKRTQKRRVPGIDAEY